MSPLPCVLVCQYRSCLRGGGEAVFAAFETLEQETGCFVLSSSNCMGQCSAGPNVQVLNDRTWYCRVTIADVPEIVEVHLQGGKRVDRLLHARFHPQALGTDTGYNG